MNRLRMAGTARRAWAARDGVTEAGGQCQLPERCGHLRAARRRAHGQYPPIRVDAFHDRMVGAIGLPIGGSIVLQELTPHMFAGVDATDDGVDDACGAVDDV